jgi:hypothetical protein
MRVTLTGTKPAALDEVLKTCIPERSVFIVFRMILTINRIFFPPKQQNFVFLKETHYALFFTGTQFLGAFTKLRKTTISFVVSFCLSARPHGTTRLPLNGFSGNLIFEYFVKICRENSGFIKI